MPENVLMGQLHLSKACWELWLSDDQPHSDYNGQWQKALCILAVLQSSQPNPQRKKKKNRKMYAIKQIKICAKYRDMLPRPRLDLSGTPVLRPIGLSPGSWQTSLGLGSMSRYSTQILICITDYFLASDWCSSFATFVHKPLMGLSSDLTFVRWFEICSDYPFWLRPPTGDVHPLIPCSKLIVQNVILQNRSGSI